MAKSKQAARRVKEPEGPSVIEIGGERFFTAAGLGQLLGMNERTIRRFYNRGMIVGTRIGGKAIVFTEKHVKDFLSSGMDLRRSAPARPVRDVVEDVTAAAHKAK